MLSRKGSDESGILDALECMGRSCPAPCRSILDHIADGVFTVDLQGRIFWFNRAAERITGYTKEEVLGRHCYEIFRSNRCLREMCPLRQTFESGESIVDLEMRIKDKKGNEIPISVSTSLIRDMNGDLIGAVETFRDLSQLMVYQKQFYERYSFQNIISQNSKMIQIFRNLRDIAQSDSPVLIQGESGTGKELLALAIHNLSPRAKRPYITVNCGAIPDTLLESELFGYERGAFTDAHRSKPGRFALASGGTIFLDEIGDLSLEVQAKLLRVLQNGEYQPLGGTRTLIANVRILSATHRDLFTMVKEGRFREDLYYRINVVKIDIPPLRERREDIPLLIDHFISKFNRKMNKSIRGLSPTAMDILLQHDYPGNIRELENIIEHSFILAKSKEIRTEHLPPYLLRRERTSTKGSGSATELKAVEVLEREALLDMLKKHRWNKGKTALALGISRTTLWRKMKKFDLIP